MLSMNAQVPFYPPNEKFAELNQVTICYEELGDPQGPPILLIMGLAAQLTAWPAEFLQPLVDEGYRVIRLDNRDIGHSSELPQKYKMAPPVAFIRSKFGIPIEAGYNLQDMAQDCLGLLDHLNIADAHIAGVSMGGMIAQLIAAMAPERAKSLVLMMTSNNHPRLPMPDLNTLWRINGSGIRGHDQEAALKRGLAFWETVQSPGFPTPRERILQRIARDYQRSYRPSGITRQMRAIMATGSIEKYTRLITAPTLILHGADDPLVKPKAAHWLKDNIPHAVLDILPGWGHDLPLPLMPKITHKIIEHIKTGNHYDHASG